MRQPRVASQDSHGLQGVRPPAVSTLLRFLALSALLIAASVAGRSQTLHASRSADVLLSPENAPSTFTQSDPRIDPRSPSGFIVSWVDSRDGENAWYAQEFDSAGHPVGSNYRTTGADKVVVRPDGRFLRIGSSYSQLGWELGFPEYLTVRGMFFDAARCAVDSAIFASVEIPWCGTGYLDNDFDCAVAGDRYFFIMRQDGWITAAEYDTGGAMVHAYPGDLFPQHAATAASVAGLPTGESAVVWDELDPYTFQHVGFFASFFDGHQHVPVHRLEVEIPFDTLAPYDWWYWGHRAPLKVVPLDDLSFLIIILSPSQKALYFQKFDRFGSPLTGAQSLPVPWREGIAMSTASLVLSSRVNGIFHALLSGMDYSSGHSVNALFTFTTLGDAVGTGEVDTSGPALWANFIAATPDSLLRIGTAAHGDVYLTSFRGLSRVDSVKVNDDLTGSNETNPRICLASNGRILFAWCDERGVAGQFTDASCIKEGGPVQLELNDATALSQPPQFFSDGSSVGLWRAAAPQQEVYGFALYDDAGNVVRRDTLAGAPGTIRLAVLTDSAFLVINSWSYPYLSALKILSRSGEVLGDTSLPAYWTGDIWSDGEGQFTLSIADYGYPTIYRALTFTNRLVLLAETAMPPFGRPIGNQRLILFASGTGGTTGTILTFAGDTVRSNFFVSGPGTEPSGSANIGDRKVLVAYRSGGTFYAKAFSDDGVQLGDSVAVHDPAAGPRKDLTFAARNDKIYFAWSEIRPPGLGYSIFGNVLDVATFVGVEDPSGPALPAGYALSQNYPNPFNPSTTIRYALPSAGHVSLKVYSVGGELVATLVDGMETPGWHEATLDATSLASGVYLCRLTAGNYTGVLKMLFVK